MKRIYVIIIAIITLSDLSYAQNTFPSTGSAGIGTTAPQANLEITNASYTAANQLIISGSENTRYYGIIGESVNSGSTIFSFGTKTNYTNYFQTLNLYNNNVGIGTTNPQVALDVNGALHANVESHFSNGTFTDPVLGTAFAIKVGGNGIAVSGNSVFLNGNVLINQTTQANSAYRLDVAGSVRANSVVINTTGADFVFEPTYKLISLPDLKIYIDKNHHLPEIESAKQMKVEGLNVGENQKKLLQKIEELTLYLISKDKQLDDQVKLNQSQQQEIDQLIKQVSKLIELSNKKQ